MRGITSSAEYIIYGHSICYILPHIEAIKETKGNLPKAAEWLEERYPTK